MHEPEVEVVCTQALERALKGGQDILGLVVRYTGLA